MEVERVVQAFIRACREAVIDAERPGINRGVDAKGHLDRVGVDHADRVLDAAGVGSNRVLVAEGRHDRDVEHRGNLPARHVERSREGNADRHLEEVHLVVVSAVLAVVHVEARPADAGVRHDVERTHRREVLGTEANREDVGVKRFLEGTEERRIGGQIVRGAHVSDVELAVDVADTVAAVERHAPEVGVVVNLRRSVDGVGVGLADRNGRTEDRAAGSGVVRAERCAVVM